MVDKSSDPLVASPTSTTYGFKSLSGVSIRSAGASDISRPITIGSIIARAVGCPVESVTAVILPSSSSAKLITAPGKSAAPRSKPAPVDHYSIRRLQVFTGLGNRADARVTQTPQSIQQTHLFDVLPGFKQGPGGKDAGGQRRFRC